MKLNEPQEYILRINNDYSYQISKSGEICTFSKPATVRGIAKIYTITKENKLLYVGIAKQPMSSRFSYGFKPKHNKGYSGYKWKELREDLELKVWTASLKDEYVSFKDIETIEAEVAFLCRHISGQWPRFQHEIHFQQSKTIHRELANLIYEKAVN